jgi:hypothetical protein
MARVHLEGGGERAAPFDRHAERPGRTSAERSIAGVTRLDLPGAWSERGGHEGCGSVMQGRDVHNAAVADIGEGNRAARNACGGAHLSREANPRVLRD